MTKNKETTQITSYTIEDDPTALAIKEDTIKVTIDGEDKTSDSNVNISVDENGKMTVVLTWADENGKTIYDYSVPVKVEYTATVTKVGADAAGIKNKATIKYNDTTVPTEVEVETYQITLKKVDDKKAALDGAEFEIRRNAQDGDALELVDLGEGTYRIATTEDTTTTKVIKAGTAIIKGLDGADKYYLKETKAPDGYNILTVQKEVTMSNADQTIEVENQAGSVLPSTGGMGTTIFYAIGAILVIGAGVVLVSRRRAN